MKTTCIATSSADHAETPLSVDKCNRFLNKRRSNCMSHVRLKITILAHSESLKKALEIALRPAESSAPDRPVRSWRLLTSRADMLSRDRGG